MGDLLHNYIGSPISSDLNLTLFIIYLSIVGIFSILGFVYGTIYNVNKNFSKKKYSMFLPLTFLTIAIILAGILPLAIDTIM